jgi:hypothetical protein
MRHPSARLVAIAFVLAACAAPPAATLEPSSSVEPSVSAAVTASPASETPEATTTATPAPPSWTEVAASGPAAREDHTWTASPGADVAYLFGGRDGGTVFGDVWAYDLAADAWTELTPASGPAPRFGHEAAWVDGVGVVIFAGQAGATFFDDLWAYDPDANAWRELPTDGMRPVGRYGSCAAVGPDGDLWISHGFTSDGVRFSDTWRYEFAAETWTEATPATGDRPVERCLHGCWWTADGELTLYAGQTTGVTALGDRWLLADGAWMELGGALPPDRNLYARAPIAGGTLLFGGQALDGSFLADTWVLPDDGGDAMPVEAAGPPERAGAELVADMERDRLLLFGGRNADGAMADMWQLNGVVTTDS